MKFKLIETKEIVDFEKELGRELVITERGINHNDERKLPRYYVLFENSDVMDNGTLIGMYGSGDTMDEALIDYCLKVSHRRIAFAAHSPFMAEVDFPKLIHTKLLGK